MTVYFNNQAVSIFRGATVGDALLSYSHRSYKQVKEGKLRIFDSFGNLTECDGSLTEGQHFLLMKRTVADKK